jgi:hypothetical protein
VEVRSMPDGAQPLDDVIIFRVSTPLLINLKMENLLQSLHPLAQLFEDCGLLQGSFLLLNSLKMVIFLRVSTCIPTSLKIVIFISVSTRLLYMKMMIFFLVPILLFRNPILNDT